MNLETDIAETSLREEVRRFASEHSSLFSDPQAEHQSAAEIRAEVVRWTHLLRDKGWLVPHWPSGLGGQGWSAAQRYILDDELTRCGCARLDRIALDLVGPVIAHFGSAEQHRLYLPAILNAEQLWCQGFSEPSAGSDVNALKTVAVRKGDAYIVSGQKLWTTNAHFADMMFALLRVRSSGALQPGLSFLLINMRARGVRVRPVDTIDGRHHLNEVFLDEVRVPDSNLIGEEGKGWTYARYLLGNERPLVASVPDIQRSMESLEALASREMRDGRPLLERPEFRLKFARLGIELDALEFTVMRALSAGAAGTSQVDVLGSVIKIRGGELRQRVSELTMEALGDRATIMASQKNAATQWPPGSEHARGITSEFLFNRSATLAGGTSEIQRNIIAGIALGM